MSKKFNVTVEIIYNASNDGGEDYQLSTFTVNISAKNKKLAAAQAIIFATNSRYSGLAEVTDAEIVGVVPA